MKLIYATSDFQFKPGDHVNVVKKGSLYVAYPSSDSVGFYNGKVISREGVKRNILLIDLIQKQTNEHVTTNATVASIVETSDAMGTAIKVPTPKISTSFNVKIEK